MANAQPKTSVCRVLIVDDHPLFRKGATQLLELDTRFTLVGEATGGVQGCELATTLQPDLILLDMNMEDRDGIETLKAMRAAGVTSKIVMLTVSNAGRDVAAAIRQGANGYLLKDMEPEDILDSLCLVIEGQTAISDDLTHLLIDSLREGEQATAPDHVSLTERETQILSLIVKGMNNKSIAREIDISEGTVKVHMKNILRKLNLNSRLEAAVWAIDNGYQ